MAMMASSGVPEIPVSRYGLTQVHAPVGGGHVDVVFVHGLNGNPHDTWTADKSKIFWPQQLLPPILEEEKARVLVYGYDADVTSFTDGASRDKIHNHAEHLIAELAANRRIRKATERPIIFVAHSLGGLVVKRALIYSSEIRGNYTEHLRSIFVSTFGILFLGTPHKGSDLAAWGSRLEAICSAVMPSKVVDTNDNLVKALKTENETLQNIDRQFIQLISRFHVYFFHEGKPTDLKAGRRFIVDETSASPTIQDVERAVIQADHSHMCKFENDSAPGFDLVAEGIQRYAGEAPVTISGRWDSERAERVAKKKAEIEEILPGSMKKSPNTESTGTTPDTSQILPSRNSPMMTDDATNTPASPIKPKESYFIVPPGFRPNTYFVGLEREYAELDKRLFGKRRHDGSACVLLHGQPGGGKSHLARQFVNKNRNRFPGGIYWICAKSREERRHAFWNIKQKVVAKDSPELCDGVNGNDFIQLVKTWFEGRHEWLIVFDGVTLDDDEDATDLANYVPDSRDSSIIYISRAKNLETKQRLLRPMPIKVGPLKEEDAKKLLFKELHIKRPSEAENKKATDLVRKIGGLPLAISAISHRLADTHEPLTKYKLSTSTDPTIEGTYNRILDDLQRLRHMEAWNLISILCWFAQDLPFEMVHLGLKILKAEGVNVRATEGTGTPDIDNTVALLMRYALIERNDPDDKESMSSSRDSLNEPEPIDMLKIHTVVQSFCCESLNAKGLLPRWLGYAVKLFSYSYHQADVRIKMKPEPGRVSDYRYYETHGKWLWNHTTHYESKMQSLEEVRALLLPTLKRIEEEIQLREPGSSQESLSNGIFQVSIFDRTSSSSDSGPPGPETPGSRPTPLPLANETEFGFPVGKSMDSPGSFGTASPGIRPKILGNSPRLPAYDDIGYESDRSGGHQETPMQRDYSAMTARPSRRSRAPTNESHSSDWQVVRNPRRQPRGRRDLGSFRPSPARAQLNRQTANGSIPRSAVQKENRRGSSPALQSLEKVQSRSPPPSGARKTSIFQRGSTTANPTQPSWAGIVAGKVEQALHPTSKTPLQKSSVPPQASMPLDRGRSRSTSKTRPAGSGGVNPSPVGSRYLSNDRRLEDIRTTPGIPTQLGNLPPANFGYSTPYPGSNSSLAELSRGRPPISGPQGYYTTSQGFNPTPLPYENNVSVTQKRPAPPDSHMESRPRPLSATHSPQSSPSSRASPYEQQQRIPYPQPAVPSGYSSQPMSRDQSHLSHNSIAETDPIRYPSNYSPQLMPTFRADSPRERHQDGRPYRKSPKTDFAVPAYQLNSSRASPQELYQSGGWAYQTSPASQQYDGAMSRSSSGPGVAVESAPGGIVSFSADPGSLQFGEHQPVSIEEARQRIMEHERRLREQQRESEALSEISEERQRRYRTEERERARVYGSDGSRTENTPYPENSLIPSMSDTAMLDEMVRTSEQQGGVSAPQIDGAVGLGVDMGNKVPD